LFAKNWKRKEAQNICYVLLPEAKRMGNGSGFASFRFEAKHFESKTSTETV
jgi:hypothetical protein